ncbi:MAG: lipase family protein [Myxococcota bacterium]
MVRISRRHRVPVWLSLVLSCSPEPSEPPLRPTTFPPPIVGGTDASDALARAPARCGQPAYAWRREGIGEVVDHTEVSSRTASLLEGLAETAGLVVPARPVFDASSTMMRYQTQDRGVLVDATALVAWPTGLYDDERDVPFLLFLHGTQGFTDGCSVDATEGAPVLAQYFASLGFFVVAPDYLGLKAFGEPTGFLHPYLVGQATAIASLDAVRAAARLGEDVLGNLRPSPEVVYFGGSQGGHAALWVDRLQPYYARELRLLGGVATVPPADLLGEATRALREQVDATGNVVAMLGASAPWYSMELNEALLSPWNEDVPLALAAGCDPGDAISGEVSLEDLFTENLLQAAAADALRDQDPFGCLFAENGLTTTSVPRSHDDDDAYGILFVLGELDSLVHTPLEEEAFVSLCEEGMPLRGLECAGAKHVPATVWSLPEIVDFLLARRAGESFTKDCTRPSPQRCVGTPPDEP